MPTQPSQSSSSLIVNSLAGALALALLLTPRFVLPCDRVFASADGHSAAMRCHWTFQVVFPLSIAALIVAGALWIVRHAEARRTVGAGLALFGLLIIAVTQSWVIGLCGDPSMPCQHSAHWLWLWAGLLVGLGFFIAVRASVPVEKSISPDPWERPNKNQSKGSNSCCG